MIRDSTSMESPGTPLYASSRLCRLSPASSLAMRTRGGSIIEYPTYSSLTSLQKSQSLSGRLDSCQAIAAARVAAPETLCPPAPQALLAVPSLLSTSASVCACRCQAAAQRRSRSEQRPPSEHAEDIASRLLRFDAAHQQSPLFVVPTPECTAAPLSATAQPLQSLGMLRIQRACCREHGLDPISSQDLRGGGERRVMHGREMQREEKSAPRYCVECSQSQRGKRGCR